MIDGCRPYDYGTHKPRGGQLVLNINQNKNSFEKKLLLPRIVSQTFCLKPISNLSPVHNVLLLKHFKNKYLKQECNEREIRFKIRWTTRFIWFTLYF